MEDARDRWELVLQDFFEYQDVKDVRVQGRYPERADTVFQSEAEKKKKRLKTHRFAPDDVVCANCPSSSGPIKGTKRFDSVHNVWLCNSHGLKRSRQNEEPTENKHPRTSSSTTGPSIPCLPAANLVVSTPNSVRGGAFSHILLSAYL